MSEDQQGPADQPWEDSTRPYGDPPPSEHRNDQPWNDRSLDEYPSGGYPGGVQPGGGRPTGTPGHEPPDSGAHEAHRQRPDQGPAYPTADPAWSSYRQPGYPPPPPPQAGPAQAGPAFSPTHPAGPPQGGPPYLAHPGRSAAQTVQGLPAQAGPAGAMVGALLAAIAAFLTWTTLRSGGESRTLSGFSVGDGRLALLIALAAGAVAGLVLAGRPIVRDDGVLIAVLGGLLLLLAIVDLIASPATVSTLKPLLGGSGSGLDVTSGIGLYLTLVGGLLVVAGGLLRWLSRSSAAAH